MTGLNNVYGIHHLTSPLALDMTPDEAGILNVHRGSESLKFQD